MTKRVLWGTVERERKETQGTYIWRKEINRNKDSRLWYQSQLTSVVPRQPESYDISGIQVTRVT